MKSAALIVRERAKRRQGGRPHGNQFLSKHQVLFKQM
jgi:hypothetical protein